MSSLSPLIVLREHGYRDTQPRRLVLQALEALSSPVSPYDIQKYLTKQGAAISPVTVYRVIELLASLGLAHRHPCSGKFQLCAHPGNEGMHGYLHCHECGSAEEFCSTDLAATAGKQAANSGFKSTTPLLEIGGTCSNCQ